MPLRARNTLGGAKEIFKPLKNGEVGMYVCGPTVYRELHVGNFRAFVAFDVVARYLRSRGLRVTKVQNFTDVDDKMIRACREENLSLADLADKYIEVYFRDADLLGVERADVHPRATEHLPEIIDLCATLLERGSAYRVNGDLYFAVEKFHSYGRLSGQTPGEREAGARVEVDRRKANPADFALWKGAKPGEPAWESPWGPGRPGWHIECSAMAMKYLGTTLDIHAGGADLIFPHHENEIAQSEASTGVPFCRCWLHNGHLNLEGEKMSKSLGNVLSVDELTKRWEPETIRYFLVSAHYRAPLNYSPEALETAGKSLERLRGALDRLKDLKQYAAGKEDNPAPAEVLDRATRSYEAAMEDDFNTPAALAAMFDLVREVNVRVDAACSPQLVSRAEGTLRRMGGILGLLGERDRGELSAEFAALVQMRESARRRRDWAEADRIRQELAGRGIHLEDTPGGVRWKRG